MFNRRNCLLVVIMLSFAVTLCQGQKVLQLEKTGSLKTIRFMQGDILVFKIHNDDVGWHERLITDMNTETRSIIFPNSVLPIDSIGEIRMRRGRAGQIIGGALQGGGANMMLFQGYIAVFQDRPVDWVAVGAGAGNIVVGGLLRRIFKFKKFKVGNNKRLRLLDLSFGPPVEVRT